MDDAPMPLHIITERDVGLFSLIQQVVAQIPWALSEGRVPVVHFGSGTCYWTPNNYRGRNTVWEYYFEPVDARFPAASIPDHLKALVADKPPSPYEVGYPAGEDHFVSSHFGDHPQLKGAALAIPYKWDDPDDSLRAHAKKVLDAFVRPRPYVARKVDAFFTQHLAGHYVIGVHARGTDATSVQEVRDFRQDSLVLSRYVAEIERLLGVRPEAKILVASDEESSLECLSAAFAGRVVAYDTVRHRGGDGAGAGPTGWIMPAYIAADRDVAAKNGEDAVIEYQLLSRCDYLLHNGSSLARTVLLNAPHLPHRNTHRRPASTVDSTPAAAADRNPVGEL